jgi:hypothetical protein
MLAGIGKMDKEIIRLQVLQSLHDAYESVIDTGDFHLIPSANEQMREMLSE